MTQEEIKGAIDFATSNREMLEKSSKAGCYYCMKIYDASEVTDFLEQEETALCPKCGIDSVLPSSSPYELTAENLSKLYRFWF